MSIYPPAFLPLSISLSLFFPAHLAPNKIFELICLEFLCSNTKSQNDSQSVPDGAHKTLAGLLGNSLWFEDKIKLDTVTIKLK